MDLSETICKLVLHSILISNFVLMDTSINSIHAIIGNYSTIQMNTCGLLSPKNSPKVSSTTSRIIDGHLAKLGEFPWHAGISHSDDIRRQWPPFCNGVLIHEYWILTSEYCLKGANIRPLADLNITLGSINSTEYYSTYKVNKVVTHHEYPLSLIRLSKEVLPVRTADDSGYRLNFICLPNNLSINTMEESAVLSSFGAATYVDIPQNGLLHKAVLNISSFVDCKKNRIGNLFICVIEKKYLTCDRDLGSGLVQMDGNRAMLIGILVDFIPVRNRILVQCRPGTMVFIRVSYFIDFLKQVIEREPPPVTDISLTSFLSSEGNYTTDLNPNTTKISNFGKKLRFDLFFSSIIIIISILYI